MKTQFLSQLLVEINKHDQKVKSCTLSLSDLHSYASDKISALVKENEIIITNFLPDEINKPIDTETHNNLCKKLFFCPLKEVTPFDFKSDASDKKTLFIYEKSSLLEKENSTFDLIIRSLSNNENFDLIVIDESYSLDETLKNILRYNQIFICVKDITLSTQVYIISLAYKKSIQFITNPSFSPFRCLLLGLPFPNIINFDQSKSLRFFVNQIINAGKSSIHQTDAENISLDPFSDPKKLITFNQSEFYKSTYNSIYLEDDPNLQYLWCSQTEKKLLNQTSSPVDFANNKFFRKSTFNFLESNFEETSCAKEIKNITLRYLLTPTECLTTKMNIADIIVKYPQLMNDLCQPISELGISDSDLCRRNAVSACVDFSFKFSEDNRQRKELLEIWTTMIALDQNERLAPPLKEDLYEYIAPTVLSMKEDSPDAILHHIDKLSTTNIAKSLAVHARWSEDILFNKLLTRSSNNNKSRVNLKQLIFNQLLSPFTSYFLSSPARFEKESEKWASILLNDVDYSQFNPRTSLLFIMNQIIAKKDISKFLIPTTRKLLFYAPYAMNTICYGLWLHGSQEELQLLKSHNFEFFSIDREDFDIHSKIIFIIAGLSKYNKEFLDHLADQPLPAAIPDNFYKFFNLGILHGKTGNDSESARFFRIAKELSPQTYSSVFPIIPDS